MPVGVADCVRALTPLAAKCYGTGPADVVFRMGCGEVRAIACIQQGDAMWSAVLCLRPCLRPGLRRFREEIEQEGVEDFPYMNDINLGVMGVTAITIRSSAFLRRRLHDIGIAVNPVKTMATQPKGHVPTAEEVSLFKSSDVGIVEGEMTVVGIPIGTEDYVLERATGEGKGRGAECFALISRISKRRLSSSNPSGSGQVISKGLSTQSCPSKHAGGQTTVRSGRTRNDLSPSGSSHPGGRVVSSSWSREAVCAAWRHRLTSLPIFFCCRRAFRESVATTPCAARTSASGSLEAWSP